MRVERVWAQLAVLSLLTAASTGCGNSSGRVEWRQQIGEVAQELTRQPADESHLSVAIRSPRESEVVTEDVYRGLSGSVHPVPAGRELWVFARDEDFGNWFLQYPPAMVNRERGTFSQGNVRIRTDGEWTLHVCEATAAASRRLHAAARAGEWVFTAVLPDGVNSVECVKVERRRSSN